jgi:hypothetical protein
MNALHTTVLVLATLALGACDRPASVITVPATPVAAPVPGPAGPQGDTGKTGSSGQDAVIIVAPAASAPQN